MSYGNMFFLDVPLYVSRSLNSLRYCLVKWTNIYQIITCSRNISLCRIHLSLCVATFKFVKYIGCYISCYHVICLVAMIHVMCNSETLHYVLIHCISDYNDHH